MFQTLIKIILLALVVSAGLLAIVYWNRNRTKQMETNSFFKKPPKAERAFLSPSGAEEMTGLYGIRIETEPLIFSDPDFDPELGPEIILDHLALPTVVPTELANTRYVPARDDTSTLGYEGSFYFLAEHNWVDLKEIRFLEATGNSVLAEFHLVIHLPILPPDEYPLVMTVLVEVEGAEHRNLGATRNVDGLGLFVEAEADLWKCRGKYYGHDVEIELSTHSKSFDQIAKYACSVIVDGAISPAKLRAEISEGIDLLDWKFKEFGVSPHFDVERFVPNSFYFHQRRHHQKPEVIIILDYPVDVGHWSLDYTGTENGILTWVPKN
jgi:hypothetical protein